MFTELPQNNITDILNRAFNFESKFYDAGLGCVMPQQYHEISDEVRNFEVRNDDVFLCSLPRTGSTWMQEILWLLGNNLDFEKSRNEVQFLRSPLIELSSVFGKTTENSQRLMKTLKGSSVEFAASLTGRRFLKTHLPWHLLPEQLKSDSDAKIVYTMRNPKDQIVSMYHYCLLVYKVNCTFDEFVEVFLADKMVYGSPGKHIIEFYKRRNQSNVLVVKYEDMKRDLPTIIQQCADHIGVKRSLTTDDVDNICDYLKFEKMEKNTSLNLEPLIFKDPTEAEQVDREQYNKVKFIRKGLVGGWQNYFSPETNEKFDQWIQENIPEDFGLEYV